MMTTSSRLLAFLLLLPALALADDGPVVVEQTPGFDVFTRLEEVLPSGVIRPLSDQNVWLVGSSVRPTPHGPEQHVHTRQGAVTTAAGVVHFKNIMFREKAVYQLRADFQGVSYRSAEFRAGDPPPKSLRVYHVTAEVPEDLTLRVHWTLDVGEVFLRVKQLIRVENETNVTVDYTHTARGLRLPTLGNVAMGRVVTWGLFPTGKTHGNPQPSTGQGRVQGEAGATVYRGPVQPGGGLFVEFSYDIPFQTEAVRLGAISDLDITDAAVTLRWTLRSQPRVRLEMPHRAVRARRDHVVREDMLVRGRVEAGQPIIMTIDRLPIQTRVPQTLAKTGAIGLL